MTIGLLPGCRLGSEPGGGGGGVVRARGSRFHYPILL